LDAADETVQMIKSLTSAEAFAVQCDVGNQDQVKALADQAEQLMKHPVTLLINNAGVGLGGKFDEVSLDDWQWCMQVNLWGVIYGCHYFVPKFKQQGYGAIINVASAAGFTAAPEMTAYNVTKSSVLALSETLSAELRGAKIRVNVLCPTLVPTNIMKNGRLPSHYSERADHLLMNHAFTTTDQVVIKTLNNLDAGRLYTIPQPDAKLFWWMKRAAPSLYAKLLGMGYPIFNKYIKK
ncbi:MAG: SDR family NAD(P)-dependent oxidoreductase, partial [Acinetobacter bohemicus]